MIELGQLEEHWQEFENKKVRVVVISIEPREEAEATRLGKERAQLEAIGRAQDATAQQQRRAARLQRRIWWLLGGVAVLVAMVGYVTWQSYDVVRRDRPRGRRREAPLVLGERRYGLCYRWAHHPSARGIR